jgi:hypothetical protein
MSEHHRRSAIAELLSAKRCQLWPSCCCNRLWRHFQNQQFEGRPVEQLAQDETSIFVMLSCLEAHCPSKKVRTSAAIQLLNPWWDRQRRGEELTEEFCERRRAADA